MYKKVRVGVFETNSSSTHSLTIASAGTGVLEPLVPNDKGIVVVDKNFAYQTEFGWQWEQYNDVGSKIVYSYLQAKDISNELWLTMLDKVILEHSGAKGIEYHVTNDYDNNWGYIDHQSSSLEGMNTEMFDNEETLRSFLFNRSSSIACGNDNEDSPSSYWS